MKLTELTPASSDSTEEPPYALDQPEKERRSHLTVPSSDRRLSRLAELSQLAKVAAQQRADAEQVDPEEEEEEGQAWREPPTPLRSSGRSTPEPSALERAARELDGDTAVPEAPHRLVPEGDVPLSEAGVRGVVPVLKEADVRGVLPTLPQSCEWVPLLEAWPPTPLPRDPRLYFLRLRRACTAQAFGLSFDATCRTPRGGQSPRSRYVRIEIMASLPHLGVRKGDAVVSVNGVEPNTISECRKMLAEALSVRLVMRRGPKSLAEGLGAGAHGDGFSPRWNGPRTLLSVTRAFAVDRDRGEFRLFMHRHGASQSFGLRLHMQDHAIVASQGLPHLALAKSDRLIELNGRRDLRKEEYQATMEKETLVCLLFRRELRGGRQLRLAQTLPPPEPDAECAAPSSEACRRAGVLALAEDGDLPKPGRPDGPLEAHIFPDSNESSGWLPCWLCSCSDEQGTG